MYPNRRPTIVKRLVVPIGTDVDVGQAVTQLWLIVQRARAHDRVEIVLELPPDSVQSLLKTPEGVALLREVLPTLSAAPAGAPIAPVPVDAGTSQSDSGSEQAPATDNAPVQTTDDVPPTPEPAADTADAEGTPVPAAVEAPEAPSTEPEPSKKKESNAQGNETPARKNAGKPNQRRTRAGR